MFSYEEQLENINSLQEVYSWDDLQPIHKNENCNNIRELHAARTKKKRLDVGAEIESDETKCILTKKISLLSDAIAWRQFLRDHREVNANSISFGSYLLISTVEDPKIQKKVEDLIVACLKHNCHPFSMETLPYTGLNGQLIEDIIEFCTTGRVTFIPAKDISLKPVENTFLDRLVASFRASSDQEKALRRSILGKLRNTKRYGWMQSL